MGNFACVMAHCWGRGTEILAGDRSHTFLYEQGNSAQFGGVHTRTVANLADGTFSLQELRNKIRENDVHHPVTSLVCIENTQNSCGGKTLPIAWLQQVHSLTYVHVNESQSFIHSFISSDKCVMSLVFPFTVMAPESSMPQLPLVSVPRSSSRPLTLSPSVSAKASELLSVASLLVPRSSLTGILDLWCLAECQ